MASKNKLGSQQKRGVLAQCLHTLKADNNPALASCSWGRGMDFWKVVLPFAGPGCERRR